MSPREIVAGEVVPLSPLVRRLTENNPGPFTGPGTNSYLVGRGELFVIDPGEDDDEHFAHLIDAIGDAELLGVVPTHAHPDHWPLAARLARRYDAPTFGYRDQAGYKPDRTVADLDRLSAAGATLEAVHTPGHSSDHLCYRLIEEDVLFSGDHVMGWSTTIISPPDGSLNHFMGSLERLRGLEIRRMYPAHGAPIEDPQARLEEIHRHRLRRTEQALAAIDGGHETPSRMVEAVYADVDPYLHAAARHSLQAHLDALVAEGEIVAVEVAGREVRYRRRRK